jgi:hypothetical protein
MAMQIWAQRDGARAKEVGVFNLHFGRLAEPVFKMRVLAWWAATR